MKNLVIVESPAKVKTVGKYLGDGYEVVASVGHVRDLPKSEKGSIDIENEFKPNYIISKDKQRIVTDIGRQAKKADAVLLATDPDREGEAIAWHIQQAAKLKNAHRVTFNEITKEAVLEAIQHPREIDQSLRKSQEARRVLDRLFGYTLSKLIWTKVRYGLSAGRVQSPALRILMEREREIRAFIPKTYWELRGIFKRGDETEYIAECEKTFEEKKEVEEILKGAKKKPWRVDAIREKKANEKSESAVHNLHAPAGGEQRFRLVAFKHHALRPAALRSGIHHLHAHGLDESLKKRACGAQKTHHGGIRGGSLPQDGV